MIIATRFRDLPDDQMKQIVDYVESGRPIIGMRTATHAFNLKKEQDLRPVLAGTARSGTAGFGRQVLGETWVNHHGEPRQAEHPRDHRPGRGGPPDPPGDQGRRHLGPDRRLRASASPCPATASRWSSARCSRG